jgi:hypothetical protein
MYLGVDFGTDGRVAQAVQLVERAAAAGLNGIVLADAKFAGLEKYGYDAVGHPWRKNLETFLAVCRQKRIEVIPLLPTVASADGVLQYNVNLAEGYEVKDAVFEVRAGMARLVPTPKGALKDGGFEEAHDASFPGWYSVDGPGVSCVLDNREVRSGSNSVRLEAKSATNGMCRLSQIIDVEPHRCYRLSAWVKTENLAPPESFGLSVHQLDGKVLTYPHFKVLPTQRWTQLQVVFNSLDASKLRVWVALGRATDGRVWVDDVQVSEVGLLNVLRRDGCPLSVKSEDGRKEYVEGTDFAPVSDPRLGRREWVGTYDTDHVEPGLRMLNGLEDGTRLRVSFYHPLLINGAVDVCMAEPEVYDIFARQVRRLDVLFGSPKHYLLNQNELRAAGACAACKRMGKTPGELVAINFRSYARIVRSMNRGVELLVWSDMFDPFSNARDDYYLVQGSLKGSWGGLDKDVVIMNWNGGAREKSTRFFAERGHRQVVSMNFDCGPDKAPRVLNEYLRILDATAGIEGMMYTTWTRRYDDLEMFAEMVNSPGTATQPASGR